MATLSDVATAAGVSISTASRVLNGGKLSGRISKDCARRVKKAAESVGYVPNYHARSMKLGRAETIGFVLEIPPPSEREGSGDEHVLDNVYFEPLLSGAVDAVHDAGYNLVLVCPQSEESAVSRAVRGLRERSLDAVILPAVVRRMRHSRFLAESPELPVVVVQPQTPTAFPSVDLDHAAGVAEAVAHLIELGHRRLVWLAGREKGDEPTRVHQAKEHAFLKAVMEAGAHGRVVEFDWTDESGPSISRWRLHGADQAVGSLLEASERDFTAIVCESDLSAFGAIRACLRRGIHVPGELSVVGFDNVHAEMVYPSLTTVDPDFARIGRRAMETALRIAREGEGALKQLWSQREVLRPGLVVRESTAPCPAAACP